MAEPRCNTVIGIVGEHQAFGLEEDYHELRQRVDDLKSRQGMEDNPFAAPLIGVTFVIRDEDGVTLRAEGCINALNISYLYAAPSPSE